ncbi:restriction endonuclease subunit S [Streptomyces niveus]|uniref:restriction endonuclease subunit S n=1 Tax=Streptomyces niveus TaxID=193462 RepID=UPI003693A395
MTTERAKKKSDVAWLAGVHVPVSWRRTKVKHLVSEMRAGDAITSERIEDSGNVPVYGGNGVRGFTEAPTHDGVHVLIGRQGALCGNVHLAKGAFWASEHAIVSTPARNVDARWLAHLLRTMYLGQYSVTAAQPGIGVAQISALDAYLPSLEEQEAIADFLDEQTSRIDTLISKQNQLIDTLRERRAAVISHAVEHRAPNTVLRRHLRGIRQGWSPNCYPESADGVDEWGILKTGCSNGGIFRPWENKRLPDGEEPRREHAVVQGEIVMSRANTRGFVGSPAVVRGNYPKLMLSDLNYGLKTRETLSADYAVYVLVGRRARREIEGRAKGSSPSMQKLSQGDVLALPIFVPAIHEQQEIVGHLDEQTSRIDALITKTQEHIALAKERRAALTTAVVTGQIDVCAAGRAVT